MGKGIIDRKAQARFYARVGRREGELDCLSSENLPVVERAERACHRLGIHSYVKYFITGYVETATQREGNSRENSQCWR